MSRSIDIELLRKHYTMETGNEYPAFIECEYYRGKGQWDVKIPDGYIRHATISNGTFLIPDGDYVEWLEEKLVELKQNKY